MKTECALAELLYIGAVAEKGRCYGVRWTRKYKKILRLHIHEMRNICSLFSDMSDIDKVIGEFKTVCENEVEIGKFYPINRKDNYQWSDIQGEHTEILQLMEKIIDDAESELDKLIVNKYKVYLLLNGFHNLPRVFCDENEETLCNMKFKPVTDDEAKEYADSYLKKL